MSGLVNKGKTYVADKIAEIPKPEANLENVKIKGIACDGVSYHVLIAVKNPYPHSIPICEITYALKCDGRLVASGNMPDPGSLPASTTSTLEVPMLVAHSVLVTLAKDILTDWDIDYEIDVGLTIDLPVVSSFTIPLHTAGTFKLPTLKEYFTGKTEDTTKPDAKD